MEECHCSFYGRERKTQPGLELVALSRATNPNCLFVGNEKRNLTRKQLLNIGKGKSYDQCKEFELKLKNKAASTQHQLVKAITNLDKTHNGNDKTFEGGCSFFM